MASNEETTPPLEDLLIPRDNKAAERQRRQLVLPYIAEEYLREENPLDIEVLAKKYSIPVASLYYYFAQRGISRKDKDGKPARRPASTAAGVLKEIRNTEAEALSGEAEKIGTIAITLGGSIARRWLPMIDALMAEGQTLEYIAEQIMNWYEMKAVMEAKVDQLQATLARKEQELQGMWQMTKPNFRYYLRTKILQKYADQAIRARITGVKLPVKSMVKAMQQELLVMEADLEEVEGEKIIEYKLSEVAGTQGQVQHQ